MKALIVDQPHRVTIPAELDTESLRKFLTYRDKSVFFELHKIKKARWFNPENEYCTKRINELEAKKNRCLLKMEQGVLYTYSGLAEDLGQLLGLPVKNQISYPEPECLPWMSVPTKEMRPYQKAALEKLLVVKHGGVEIGTGLGKSFIILHLVKSLGLPATVMAPSVSIASQLYDMFVQAFGKRYVGMYGDGKKQSNKKIVVAIAASLTRLVPGTKQFEEIASKPVFIADESHLTPAKTLSEICFGPVQTAPYRFFFSATQIRNDGADILLKGITGPIVYHMTVEEGVEQGYLSRPTFNMLRVRSESTYQSSDANEMDRKHLLLNPMVIRNAAALANLAWLKNKQQTLILIDEFEQAALLERQLTVEVEFAHGGVTKRADGKDMKDVLPKKFHKSDVHDQVTRFNNGEFPVLIGTSAIGLGTDIQTAKVLIFIQKGTSEVKFRQGVGRGTRRAEGKDSVTVFDFDVTNIGIVHRHALERASVYESIMGKVNFIDLG